MYRFILLITFMFSSNTFSASLGGAVNNTSITLFFSVIAITLGITWWASKRTNSASDFYSAGGNITGFQNGLAITGDALSAGAFLGLTALVFSNGFDGFVYAVGYSTGLPIVVFLMASKLRKLGKYTFTDVVCSKLKGNSLRVFSASASLIIVSFYLIAQMVGAGQLVQLMFGIDYNIAIALIGLLMVLYVAIGGMMATTWVQIIKAVMMLGMGTLICLLVLTHFGFNIPSMLDKAALIHTKGDNILIPQSLASDPISAFSLGLALMFGTAGLPHVLMRFFTVPDAKAARTSVLWATVFMNAFYAMIFIIGFGALVLLRENPGFLNDSGTLIGGGNTVALHLSQLLGGDIMFGAVSAVAFATILAVVSGLTLSGASAISHDIYGSIFKKSNVESKEEMKIVRIATVFLGALAVVLGIIFKEQNVAYMIALAFAIACSSTFPVLILAIYWKKLTSFGAVLGGTVGLISSLLFTIMGPAVWVKVLGHSEPFISINPPAIITLPLALATCIIASLLSQPKHTLNNRVTQLNT